MKKLGPWLLPLFRNVLFIVIGVLFAKITNQTLEQSSRWWSIICVACNILTIILLMIVCKKEGSTYKELISSQRDNDNLKYSLHIVALMVALGMGGMYGFGMLIGYMPVTMIQPIPIWLAVINIIVLPITVMFAELPLYFGYSLNRIKKIQATRYFQLRIPYFSMLYSIVSYLYYTIGNIFYLDLCHFCH